MSNLWLFLLLVCFASLSFYLFIRNNKLLAKQQKLLYQLNFTKQNIRTQQDRLELFREKISYSQKLEVIQKITNEHTDVALIYELVIDVLVDFLKLEMVYIIVIDSAKKIIKIKNFKTKLNDLKENKLPLINQQLDITFKDDQLNYLVDDELDILQQLIDIPSDSNINTGINFSIFEANQNTKREIIGLYAEYDDICSPKTIDFISKVITQLETVKQKNQQQEKYYLLERAINSSTNGIVIVSVEDDNGIIYVNEGFEKITGYKLQNIIGQNCRFLHGEDRQQPGIDEIRQAIINQQPTTVTIRNYRQNEELFWNEIYFSPVYNQQGQVTNFIGIQTDVTQKYQTEKKLERKTKELEISNQQLNITNEINLNIDSDLNQLLNLYLEKVNSIVDIDIILISESVANKHPIVALYDSLSQSEVYTNENNLISYFAEQVLVNKNIYFYNQANPDNSNIDKSLLENISFGFYIGVPIYLEQNIYGVLHLLNLSEDESKFNESKNLIKAISQRISRIIKTQEITLEKEQINIALQESQERLSTTISSLEDVVWSIHPDTFQLIYINQAAENLFNIPLAKLFKTKLYWLDLIDSQQRAAIEEQYSSLLNISLLNNQNHYHDLEYRVLLEDGSEKYFRDRAHVIYDDGGSKISVNGILTDITNTVKAQKALTKSEQEFRLMFELAPIGMMITNKEGKIIQVNNSFCELLKTTPNQLININEKSLIHPDSIQSFIDFKIKILTELLEYDQEEICLLASNGSLVYTIFNITVLRDDKGEVKQFIQQIIDVSELKIIREEMFYETFYDNLTSLPNRFLFIDRIKQYLKLQNKNSCYAVLLIDIDNFKKINDSWGHQIGDELLVLISVKMANCLGSKDVLARISGDEFVIFLPDVESITEVEDIVQKIMVSCRINTTLQDKTVICSVSIGIAFGKTKTDEPEEMIRDADLAMYSAKEKGKNNYQIFANSMRLGLVKKINLESSLSQAVEKQELKLYYQPIICLQTGKIAGFEALIRWFSPIHGLVSPIEFIPLAEETGLIISLGEWILLSATQQIKQWQNKYRDLNLFVAVNISSKQLLHPDFLILVDQVLRKTQINSSLLKIEITETILMEKYEYARQVLENLKSRGLKISLDDFGTGYSSLSYLNRLPFDNLKIDQSFIKSLITPQQPTPIVEAIVNLADSLCLSVVAEGIETQVQEKILKNINCRYGQGYLYAKPLSVLEAEDFIDKNS